MTNETGKPSTEKMTIKDIARMAGVSVATVSKIFNGYSGISDKTRKNVMEIMERTGYRPTYIARALVTQTSNIIGVIYAGKINAEFNHPFFVDVVNAFKTAIGQMGYDLLFFSNEQFHYEKEDYLARCRHFSVDGCLILSGQQVQKSVYDLAASEIPCAAVDLPLDGPKTGYIMTDNRKMADAVIRRFMELGHTDIAYIGGGRQAVISGIRLEAFLEAAANNGLKLREEWIVQQDTFDIEEGYERMKLWLSQEERPKAVFASTDMYALGAIRAIREKGLRVPDDISVIGCDDIAAARYMHPPLTTIRQDKPRIGTMAAELLVELIQGRSDRKAVLVEPELVVRGSCREQACESVFTR